MRAAGASEMGHSDAQCSAAANEYDSPGDGAHAAHGQEFMDDDDLANMPLATGSKPEVPGHRRTIR